MSPLYKSEFEKLEVKFRTVHGTTVKPGSGSVQSLVSDMRNNILLPTPLIEYFFRLRIYFRIKKLNSELTIESKRKCLRKLYKTI